MAVFTNTGERAPGNHA